jgi:AcrR family transcriptional regulator
MATEPSVRWRRRKDARPGEILEAALDCFAERGFAATRLEDVAARAGVTKGTAYLYFKNKDTPHGSPPDSHATRRDLWLAWACVSRRVPDFG